MRGLLGRGGGGSFWRVEASSADRTGFINIGRLTPAEFFGCLAAGLLVSSLFLPWFGTSEENKNSELEIIGQSDPARLGETATAWQTFPILRWLLVAAAAAPFILLWIVARGHDLTWKPGEVTMIVGITAFVLILCNGIILGKPGEDIEISLAYGYAVALVAGFGVAVSGYLRQAAYQTDRKPPGVI